MPGSTERAVEDASIMPHIERPVGTAKRLIAKRA